jgi:MYXO-CTERM domain-containing protein
MPPGDNSPGGCSCEVGGAKHSVFEATPFMLVGLGLVLRRRRRARH